MHPMAMEGMRTQSMWPSNHSVGSSVASVTNSMLWIYRASSSLRDTSLAFLVKFVSFSGRERQVMVRRNFFRVSM